MNGMAVSIGRVAWGYVFLYINININLNAASLNLMPDWACYAFVLAALPGLTLAEKSSALLRPLAWVLLIAELANWLLALFDISLYSGALYIVEVVVIILSLYFHFQLLTNVADIAARYSEQRAKSIRTLRNVTVVFRTLFAIPWPVNFLGQGMLLAIGLVSVVMGIVMVIWTLSSLFGLRNEIRSSDDGMAEPGE